MYARVLRKWSPNTNLMSFLWPAAVALLLLVACAPPTTSTPTPASAPASAPSASAPAPLRPATTTSTDSARATAGASAMRQAPAPPPATAAAPAPSTRPLPLPRTRWRGLAGAAAAAGPVPGPPASAGGGEESFFIPVAVGVGPAGRAGPGGPSSSRSSSSSSRTRSSSSSRLISSSWRRGPAPADRLAFAYYRAPAEEAADGDDGEEPEAEELGAEEPEQEEEEEEEDEESEESEEQVADSPVAAAALSPIRGADNARIIRNDIDNDDDSSNPKPVPNVPNSQILNLHTPVDTTDRQRQQQRRGLGAAAASVRGPKARRHVQESRQESPRAAAAAAASFHSPVRETAAVGAGGNATLAPLRFVIESFEVPATLPLAAFTEQQRRMLLQQQQLRRLRLLQQQAARSRRDSRAFGASGPQLFYGAQQQQQQPYQRLQQPQPHAPTYGSGVQKPHHHHQHQHQRSQHQHQQQQHQQRRRRRYCSARDPAQLAFEAPTVFEGKIVSMTPDRRANFSATVEVKEVFKQQIGFRLQKYLRLQFAYRNSSGECDIYREQLRPRGLVRGDELEQGRVYLLFVQQIDLGNFTILGQPIRKTRRVVEAVKNAVSENYAQLASIRSITASNRTVENGKELRIVCKVQGRPPPKVTWFKDHKSINRNRKLYQIVPFKKRSELIIRSFNSSDAGRYECRAKNKVNRNLERRAIVIKAYPVPRYETHLTGGTGHNCPPDAAEFCFNGGTCKLFVEIGSYSCICPEGFIGERCDRKEVNNMPPNPTYKTGYIADDPGAYDPDLDPGPLDREHISQSYTSSEDADDDDADDDDDDSGEEDETKASRVGF